MKKPLEQKFSASLLLAFGVQNSLFRECTGHCEVFSCIPGLYICSMPVYHPCENQKCPALLDNSPGGKIAPGDSRCLITWTDQAPFNRNTVWATYAILKFSCSLEFKSRWNFNNTFCLTWYPKCISIFNQ